jgi:hypothetical protein
MTAAAAHLLVHNGFLTVDDLQGAHDLELATTLRIDRKSLAALRWATAIEFRGHLAATPGRMVLKFDTERAGPA